MANIEMRFIKSNVDFTAASGWLQRLVRCGATLSQPVHENPHLTQRPEKAIVKQIVTLVVVCLADVDRMRVAANQRTEPAMLVVSDG